MSKTAQAGGWYLVDKRFEVRCPCCSALPKVAYSTQVGAQNLYIVTCEAHYCRDRAARGLLCLTPTTK